MLAGMQMLAIISAFTLNAATAPDPVAVPFEFYHGAILVEAMVNGKGPFTMMLDTGTNPSVIDLAAARQMGLKLSTKGERGSGTGTDVNLAYKTSLPKLQLSGLTAGPVEAFALDLSTVSGALGRPLSGVLGYSMLKDRVVQFDYPHRIARFYAASPYPRDAAAIDRLGLTVLPFRSRDDILVSGVLVNGRKVVATFDTGSNDTFQLTPAAIAHLGLEKEASAALPSHSVGFNGTGENREGQVESISIGGITVDRPRVTFFTKRSGHDEARWGLNIGNGFLKQFVLTVDYRSRIITLQRPGGATH